MGASIVMEWMRAMDSLRVRLPWKPPVKNTGEKQLIHITLHQHLHLILESPFLLRLLHCWLCDHTGCTLSLVMGVHKYWLYMVTN